MEGASDSPAESARPEAAGVAPPEPQPVRPHPPLRRWALDKIRRAPGVIWDARHDKAVGPAKVFWLSMQIAARTIEGYIEHRNKLRAAALTYSAFLSFIPLLALVFSLLSGLGVREQVVRPFVEMVTGTSGDATASIERATQSAVNFINGSRDTGMVGVGILGLIWVTYSMLRMVETALNAIWEVDKRRTPGEFLGDYFAFIILAPILLGAGATVLQIIRVPESFPYASIIDDVILWPLLTVIPYIAIWTVFVFVYYYMPHTKVYWVSALIGGLIGGYLWMLAQHLYVQVTLLFNNEKYNTVYKSFAWVFILIVWVNISWHILLLGAEITCAHQKLSVVRRRKRPWRGTPADWETLALRLAALLARPALAPAEAPFQPMTSASLADELAMPPAPVERALDLFEGAGIIRSEAGGEGKILCRAPEMLTALDMLRLVREGAVGGVPVDAPDVPAPDPLESARNETADALRKLTVRQLAQIPIERIRSF